MVKRYGQLVVGIIGKSIFGSLHGRLGILDRHSLDVLDQLWLILDEMLVEPNASPSRACFETSETPDTELTMKGTERYLS